MGRWGQPAPSWSVWLGRRQPLKGLHLEVGYLGEVWEGDARVNEVCALLCHDVSCLRNILLLFGMDAGDSTRLFLRGETCLEMENTVYYSCLLQRCLVGLLDAGLNSERCCTDTVAESL